MGAQQGALSQGALHEGSAASASRCRGPAGAASPAGTWTCAPPHPFLRQGWTLVSEQARLCSLQTRGEQDISLAISCPVIRGLIAPLPAAEGGHAGPRPLRTS